MPDRCLVTFSRLTGDGQPYQATLTSFMKSELPQRKRLYHKTPVWVKTNPTYFITICCKERIKNQLCKPDVKEVIWESIEYYHANMKWHCSLFLLMPDHIHALMCFPESVKMTDQIKTFKGYIAKKTSISFQQGFFDHRMRESESIYSQYDYILQNPVRAGLCNDRSEWGYVWKG